VDLSVLATSEVDHAGELLGAPPAVLDGSVRISSHGVNSRQIAQPCGDFPGHKCRHRMPPTISPIVRIRVSPSRACLVLACGRPLCGGCPLAGEKDDVPA